MVAGCGCSESASADLPVVFRVPTQPSLLPGTVSTDAEWLASLRSADHGTQAWGCWRSHRPQDGHVSLLCGAGHGPTRTQSAGRAPQFSQGLVWKMSSGGWGKFGGSPGHLFCRMTVDCGRIGGAPQQHVLSLQCPDIPPHVRRCSKSLKDHPLHLRIVYSVKKNLFLFILFFLRNWGNTSLFIL